MSSSLFWCTHATLTPVAVRSLPGDDSTWTKDVEVTPGVADLALDKIAQTWSGREVTGRTVVAEVGHDGAPKRGLGEVSQSLLKVVVAQGGKGGTMEHGDAVESYFRVLAERYKTGVVM